MMKTKRTSAIQQQIPNQIEITPLVKGLAGVITLGKNFDRKKDLSEHLKGKYSK